MKRDTVRTDLLAAGDATRALGAYAAGLRYADLPSAVAAKAKECVLDALGCCLNGVTQPWTRMMLDMVMEQGGAPQASIPGTTCRTSASQAALVTGTAGHGFELDDIHVQAHLHPGSLTVPVALALGEWRGNVSGRRFLTAVIAGYEVAARVGMSVGAAHLIAGWHPTGTHGTLGAAAACGSLLGLTPEQMQHALGIAGTQAGGLMASQFGSMVKRFHAGRAAQSGVYAGLLAARGFTGIPNVLEAPYGGFLSAFTDTAMPEHLTEGFGKRWEILKVGYKPYASAASTHTALHSLREIMKENRLKAQDIGEVRLHCSSMAVKHCAWEYVPQGVTSAQMSLYYTLAAMAHDGEVLTEQFAESRLADPQLLAFMRRIRIEADPQYDRGGDATRHQSRMSVTTVDGRRFEKDAPLRKGSPDFPMTADERHAKFRRLASAALSAGAVEGIIREVEALDQAGSIAALVALLRAGDE